MSAYITMCGKPSPLVTRNLKKRHAEADSKPQNLDLLEPHNLIPNGVWTFDAILRHGEEHKLCPYFTARRMVSGI